MAVLARKWQNGSAAASTAARRAAMADAQGAAETAAREAAISITGITGVTVLRGIPRFPSIQGQESWQP